MGRYDSYLAKPRHRRHRLEDIVPSLIYLSPSLPLPVSFQEIATALAVLRSLLLPDVLVPLKRVALQKQKRRGREVTRETETETAAAAK